MAAVRGESQLVLQAQPQANRETNFLEQLVSEASVRDLEAAVKIGVEQLQNLEQRFGTVSEAKETQTYWIKQIRKLHEKVKNSRIVIGVVGNTGAGKSSLINAVLDEERLVPTSGMRACTAAAMEISFNYAEDPQQLYRAEVEFISLDDWAQELGILMTDLLDADGQVSGECSNPDTDAGLAYSKIKAVYPTKDQEAIAKSSPAEMLGELAGRGVLGSVKHLAAATASSLHSELQQYVVSQDKLAGQCQNLEYCLWPLVKVVRIYCKADALSTGAVLVDLPGSGDMNAARAAVADAYIKSCSGLWVTAAIQRAVDEKAAKKLLGESFRRQLKFDGAFSAVTFICTKTDDILTSEVGDFIEDAAIIRQLQGQIGELEQKQADLKCQLATLKEQKSAATKATQALTEKSKVWNDLKSDLRKGQAVFRPSEDSKKRKRRSGHGEGRKNPNLAGETSESDDGDDIFDSSDEEGDDFEDSSVDSMQLTASEIDAELSKIDDEKRESRGVGKDRNNQLNQVKRQASETKKALLDLKSEQKSRCVKGRNRYSMTAVKCDFAMGIKELDEEAASLEDELAFDPDGNIRDYDAVAEALPVFCISARAYQKLRGRLPGEAVHVEGFRSIEETEIPRLQIHLKVATEEGRANEARRSLTKLNELLTSMKLWVAGDSNVGLRKEDRAKNENFVRAQLGALEVSLNAAVEDCIASIRAVLRDKLHGAIGKLIPIGAAQAVAIAKKWGAPRAGGGLAYGTYKATCRRFGAYGPRNFNNDLFDPVSRRLAQPWERVFQMHLPSALKNFAKSSQKTMEGFHEHVVTNVPEPSAKSAVLSVLLQQLRIHRDALDVFPHVLRGPMTEAQRDASRKFQPMIQEAMTEAYQTCRAEKGKGSYQRMKEAMISHVDRLRYDMFEQSARVVKDELEIMCQTTQFSLTEMVEDLLAKLERDYIRVLVGDQQVEADRQLRLMLRQPVAAFDHWFSELLRPGMNVGCQAPAAAPAPASWAAPFQPSEARLMPSGPASQYAPGNLTENPYTQEFGATRIKLDPDATDMF